MNVNYIISKKIFIYQSIYLKRLFNYFKMTLYETILVSNKLCSWELIIFY